MESILVMIIFFGSQLTLALFGWCMISEWKKRHQIPKGKECEEHA